MQVSLPSRDLDQPAGWVSVPPGWGAAQDSHHDGGQSSSRIEGVGLTDSLQDGGLIPATGMRGLGGGHSPSGMGVTPPAGWGSLSQQAGALSPSGMEGHSLQRDGGHSPSGMGVTPAGWGSLPQWDGGLSPSGMGPTVPAGWRVTLSSRMGVTLPAG